jgi:hypothetical protein
MALHAVVTSNYPLIMDQHALHNSLFERMFLVMVPKWCQG